MNLKFRSQHTPLFFKLVLVLEMVWFLYCYTHFRISLSICTKERRLVNLGAIVKSTFILVSCCLLLVFRNAVDFVC
jgi:hypothetical protein